MRKYGAREQHCQQILEHETSFCHTTEVNLEKPSLIIFSFAARIEAQYSLCLSGQLEMPRASRFRGMRMHLTFRGLNAVK